jgi:hypothetical protein
VPEERSIVQKACCASKETYEQSRGSISTLRRPLLYTINYLFQIKNAIKAGYAVAAEEGSEPSFSHLVTVTEANADLKPTSKGQVRSIIRLVIFRRVLQAVTGRSGSSLNMLAVFFADLYIKYETCDTELANCRIHEFDNIYKFDPEIYKS